MPLNTLESILIFTAVTPERLFYFMNKINMNRQGANFANGTVWYTIAFKVSAFYFFG